MLRVTIVSGKNGGLQAMVPMMEHFLASGRWEVTVLLWDQHTRSYDFGRTSKLPDGVKVALGLDIQLDRIGGLLRQAATADERLFKTDLVIVYGDRLDALLGAAKAHELGTPVAHLQAGDLSGGVDHANRYATTALSTWAFCATTEQEIRLNLFRETFEGAFQVERVGDHHIDAIMRVPSLTKGGVLDRWMVHLHPDTLATPEENRRIADMVIGAVGRNADYIMPCNDRMHEVILAAYDDHGIVPLKYLPLEEYIGRLCLSKGLIGNSSAGVIDAPALGVCSIMVGNRQYGRALGACQTLAALEQAMRDKPPRHTPSTYYGDGEAGRRTFEILDGHFA